jgi:cell wall-associated NlpC family hydrolase
MLSILLMAGPSHAADRATDGLDDLFLYAASLVGTPYQMGGSSPETGLDCSGFVHHVFMETFHADLPRTAADMSQAGQPVDLPGLQPGDLVFFNTLKRPASHVGIYLGENRFIHASSSAVGSVTISNLQDEYWSSHYDGARRIALPISSASMP